MKAKSLKMNKFNNKTIKIYNKEIQINNMMNNIIKKYMK